MTPDKVKLKKLTDHFGLPAHNGELLLSEIKLDNNPVNDKFRKAAKYLGLL